MYGFFQELLVKRRIRMKKNLLFIGALILGSTLLGATHRDGTYRGFYGDQVEVEFKLENNVVTQAKYRDLSYKGVDYRKDEGNAVVRLRKEYEALLTHLEGRDISKSLDDLYTPGEIEMAGATVRSNKVRSAIQDGLNRGAYNLAK